MARNRKRAKERRARRPAPVATSRSVSEPETPDPIEHATPDVELAEVQLAVGRPEPSEEPEPEGDYGEQELEADAFDDGSGGSSRGGGAGWGGSGSEEGGGGELAMPAAPGPVVKQRAGARLVNFLQGSWNELQRVQWPDRRQTLQATGVVIGFVIVAGVFLGVADALAAKLVNYIIGR